MRIGLCKADTNLLLDTGMHTSYWLGTAFSRLQLNYQVPTAQAHPAILMPVQATLPSIEVQIEQGEE